MGKRVSKAKMRIQERRRLQKQLRQTQKKKGMVVKKRKHCLTTIVSGRQ
jgi:hypothetical protein